MLGMCHHDVGTHSEMECCSIGINRYVAEITDCGIQDGHRLLLPLGSGAVTSILKKNSTPWAFCPVLGAISALNYLLQNGEWGKNNNPKGQFGIARS